VQSQLATRAEASQQRAKQLDAELGSLRDECDRLRQQLGQPREDGVDVGRLRSVEADRDALQARLVETEDRLAEAMQSLADAQPAGGQRGPADEDAQRHYEMALEDLRELKAQNAELQGQLAQVRSSKPAVPAGAGTLDWEAMKQRLLASLESGAGEDTEEAKTERLKIGDVLRETDRALAEKEQECSELRLLLQQRQSSGEESTVVGAAALGEILDSDAVVREERQKLKQLQEQWREKLRQGEIDVSLERAKLARERTELEARLAAIEKRAGQPGQESGDSASPDKPTRGRWLARLGLTGAQEDPRDRR
jgi:hypothetical protein